MKTPKSRAVDPRRTPISWLARLVPMLTMLTAGAWGGCGSSAGNGPNNGELDEFLGTWTIDRPSSTFGFTCPAIFDGNQNFSIWTVMTFEPGTVVDLVETQGRCLFNFDVTGKVAIVPTPDPFTGSPPVCRVSIDSTGTEFLDFKPTSWKFSLILPEKDKAPPARMLGSATVTHVSVGPTGIETGDSTACSTYEVDAFLSKITSH